MHEITIIEELEKRIKEICHEQQLTSLLGLIERRDDANAFVHDGVDLKAKYYHIVQEGSGFPRHENFGDLEELSEQILCLTAQACLYAPHARRIQQMSVSHYNGAGEPRYHIYHDVYGERHDMYADCVAEKLYAYWTRLAMLLNHYLPRPLKVNSVDFSRVIDQLDVQLAEHQQHPAFEWLKAFKAREQQHLNDERRVIVHHITTPTTFWEADQLREDYSAEELTQVMEERLSRPALFKAHMKLSITALSMVLDAIAVIVPPPPRTVYF